MSTETLQVQKRAEVGSNAVKKIRQQGYIPAILYGHGEENVNLSVRSDLIHGLIEQGAKMLALTGDVDEYALVRHVQWDAFGSEVIHVDLTRVSRRESVEVSIPIELHGEAPGTNEGGMMIFTTHEVTIACPASSIPEQFEVSVSKLHVGDAVHAEDIELPKGASLVTPGSEVLVQVVMPTAQETAEEEPVGDEAEPELVGQAEEESEEEAPTEEQ